MEILAAGLNSYSGTGKCDFFFVPLVELAAYFCC